ncbi:MAG: rhomboid family intramembrane serine protease [Sulfolobales archaeon]
MIPGETFVKGTKRAYATYFLIVINTVIYLLTSYNSYFLQISQKYLWEYSFVPVYLTSLDGWLRIFTSMFLHGYPLHILFNMYFLYVFGKAVESYIGARRYLLLYFFSGFIASMTHSAMTFFSGVENLGIPALGASGAISGVIGSFLALFPGTRMSICFFFFIIPLCGIISSTYFIIFWFALQVIYGYLQLGGVAFFAHVGGFLAGFFTTVLLARGVKETLFPDFLYQITSFNYTGYPWYTYKPRGLGTVARFILIILTLIVAIGEVISIYSATTTSHDVYYFTLKADLAQGSSIYSSEAIVVILHSQATSSYLVAPIADDIIRILFNRLFYAGYIVNQSLKNYIGTVYFNGLITIPNLRAPPVQLNLLMNASYNSNGILVSGEGRATTDLLICKGSFCEIQGKWVYNLFTISGVGPVSISEIIYIPAILSIIVTFAAFFVLILKIDREVSLT